MSSFLRLSVMIFVEVNFLIFYIKDVTVGCLNCKLAYKGMNYAVLFTHDIFGIVKIFVMLFQTACSVYILNVILNC